MKKPIDLEWRLYGLVPYNLSSIQQAIQYGHALQEMNNYVFNLYNGGSFDAEGAEDVIKFCDAFSKWRSVDKTFIILNGGTTNFRLKDEYHGEEHIGSLNNHLRSLKKQNVIHFDFYEPDLGDQLTAIVFLVDERVWNKDKYPDFLNSIFYNKNIDPLYSIETAHNPVYKQWIKSIGGEKNVWLREFLKQFKLA